MRLLLLHGFTGRGDAWQEVASHLPPELEVDAPDLPGHRGAGSSARDERPADFESTLDLLARRHLSGRPHADRPHADRRPAEPVHLVGYSLGGRLALGLALRQAGGDGPIRRLTLIGARPGLDGEERQRRADADRRLAAELRSDFEGFVDRWQQLPLFESQARLSAERLAAQRRRRLAHDPAGLAWALETLSPGRMPDYRPLVRQLELPVDLVVGALDAPYRAIAADLLTALSDGRLHRVPGAGHNVPLEAPEALAERLAAPIDLEPASSLGAAAR